MALDILTIQTFWASNSTLTAQVAASNVWLDIAGDGASLPYVIVSQIAEKNNYQTNGDYQAELTFQFTIYAATLASVDTIYNAINNVFTPTVVISSHGFACFRKNVLPRAEQGGAYACVVEYRLLENYP